MEMKDKQKYFKNYRRKNETIERKKNCKRGREEDNGNEGKTWNI